jgi:predicted nucleotidyltransferase
MVAEDNKRNNKKEFNENKYISKDTFLYHMIQKCGYLKTLEVFFREPTKTHFIRSVSKEINLAQTSVRNHFKFLIERGMIINKNSEPFNGYAANRENEDFIFYKMIYNLSSLKKLKDFIINSCYPKSIVLFGSYLRGDDIESSDIDLFILSNNKRDLDFSNFENVLKRKINVLFSDSLDKLDKKIQNKIKNGFVLEGEL